MTKSFTPQNSRPEQIWCEVLHLHNIPKPPSPKANVLRHEPRRWCKFHKVHGHHAEDCYQLKKEIERLIQEERLKKYVKGDFSHVLDKSNLRGRDEI